ncbi:hypothetical protein QVD17_37534 [Tagetes erecta]|uniref:Uncharacterized protein n=1 Tax=Tagetes erecta TaxID=13708 RepID=A0AAD8JWW0_TARER|nr:hypothetical protein QVD17_37534 [Tagetes erecta]
MTLVSLNTHRHHREKRWGNPRVCPQSYTSPPSQHSTPCKTSPGCEIPKIAQGLPSNPSEMTNEAIGEFNSFIQASTSHKSKDQQPQQQQPSQTIGHTNPKISNNRRPLSRQKRQKAIPEFKKQAVRSWKSNRRERICQKSNTRECV